VKRVDGVVLRTADAADVEAIVVLFLACWRTSYRDILPADLIAMYGPTSARDLWQRSFAEGPGDREVVVAERPDQSMVGVVALGRDPDRAGTGHIFSLYVHPDAQGLGVGARLVSAAVERFRADDVPQASLWVFEANAGARAFYGRLGWLPDGTIRVEREYGEPEIRLTRSMRDANRPP